jgi:solute carrier family 25 (peroxisomal adenine nucleotide transporter), member 17
MFGIAVTQGVYYYWYEFVKARFEQQATTKRAISTLESIIAGAIAGAATTISTNPIWVVNTRQTVKGTGEKLSTFDTVRKILREEGPAGFWKGLMPALILVINPIIQYTAFEKLKALLETRRAAAALKEGIKAVALSGTDFFVLGALSKLAATSITYPYM